MDFQEVKWGLGRIELAQGRHRWWPVVSAVMNIRVT